MYVDKYLLFLEKEERKSDNTLQAYRTDINDFRRYINSKGSDDLVAVTNTDVVGYLLELKAAGKSSATINRKIASLRNFYGFMRDKHYVKGPNPAKNITVPKGEAREIEYLTEEEVVRLIESPEDTLSGKRDRAILELMYATGMMVNEVIAARVSDVNLRLGFIAFDGTYGKARIVPIGRPAQAALSDYLDNARTQMLKGKEDKNILFLNYTGKGLTRQGLWKILKQYGEKSGLDNRITPHILRDSFAVHMINHGADLKSLQELMGHEDISATEIYLSVRKIKIKEVYDMAHPRA